MDVPQPLAWEQRMNSASPLPGGYSGYLESLLKICERIERGSASFEELVAWMSEEFHVSENSARVSLAFLRKSTLLHYRDGIVSANEQIRQWMCEPKKDSDVLIGIMHSRVKFVGEMLSELDEPKSTEALRQAASRYGLDWETHTQIDNRRGWLQSAKLIDGAKNELALTDTGRRLLGQLKNHDPGECIVESDVANVPEVAEQTKPTSPNSDAELDADQLGEEIISASTDSKHPDRFEKLVRNAFQLMGFKARHFGGSGKTDVLLTAPLGTAQRYVVAVDAKTAGKGSVPERQVDWPTLVDHRESVGAKYSLLVAPAPKAERLIKRAKDHKVAILSANQLAELCRRHARTPLSLVDYEDIFVESGEVDLEVVAEGTEHFESLKALMSALPDLLFEKTDQFGPMTARDVHLALDDRVEGVSEEDIQSLLDMLAHPLIGLVHAQGNGNSDVKTRYVMATSRDCCARRIRLLADIVSDVEC